eukprot:357078-Chlamydomonas_euryale.AAC.3
MDGKWRPQLAFKDNLAKNLVDVKPDGGSRPSQPSQDKAPFATHNNTHSNTEAMSNWRKGHVTL